MQPIATAIPYEPPMEIIWRLPQNMPLVWLDSAQLEPCGRYSYLAIDPIDVVTPSHNLTLLPTLRQLLSEYACERLADIPPFQGGLAGYWSYDVGREWMPLRTSASHKHSMPVYQVGVFDCVLSFDHLEQKAWVVIVPIQNPSKRLAQCLDWLKRPKEQQAILQTPQISTASLTIDAYIDMVKAGQEYILNGDIFEVNLTMSYTDTLAVPPNPRALYDRLRTKNAAPFSALVQLETGAILSSSPERLFSLHGSRVQARPIKGTIRRSNTDSEDRQLATALRRSDKDMAENTMIVDLLRNDLSRVCEPDSVKVPQFCGLESYATVHHLVSVVEGSLKPALNAVDVFEAVFPGGSITGAPKCRAMEVIDMLETVPRGPYCGSAGYFAFNGDCDLSILIRTLVLQGNMVTYQAGGAVTLHSEPKAEYLEAVLKASRLQAVVTGA